MPGYKFPRQEWALHGGRSADTGKQELYDQDAFVRSKHQECAQDRQSQGAAEKGA